MSNLGFLLDGWSGRLGRRHQSFDDDGSGLRAAVEAGAATGAIFAGILRRMYAVMVQFGRQFEAFGRTRLHTQAAPFAFFGIDDDITARLRRH